MCRERWTEVDKTCSDPLAVEKGSPLVVAFMKVVLSVGLIRHTAGHGNQQLCTREPFASVPIVLVTVVRPPVHVNICQLLACPSVFSACDPSLHSCSDSRADGVPSNCCHDCHVNPQFGFLCHIGVPTLPVVLPFPRPTFHTGVYLFFPGHRIGPQQRNRNRSSSFSTERERQLNP